VSSAGLDEHWRSDTTGISDQGDPPRRQQATENHRQQLGVFFLVQHVGREYEIEGAKVLRQVPPVNESRSRDRPQIAKHIRARDVQRILVVVGGENVKSGARCRQGAEPHPAAQLERGFAAAIQLQQPARENDRRRPHVSPVRKPLVLDEVFFANEVVGIRRLQNAEGVLVHGRVLDRCAKPASESADECFAVQDGVLPDLRQVALVYHSENAEVSSRL
jgi:hypothetical protein